jgi:hypothetical protein
MQMPQAAGQAKRVKHGAATTLVLNFGPNERVRSYEFLYGTIWCNWEFLLGATEDQDEFLVRVNKIEAAPGVNWVAAPPKDRPLERPNIGPAVTTFANKGGEIIQPGDNRLGEFQYYVGEYPTNAGKTAYCDSNAEEPIKLPGNRPTQWTTHSARWLEFRRHIVASGIVPPLGQIAYDMLEGAAADVAATNAQHALSDPQRWAAKAKNTAERVRRMRACWERMQAPKPAPVPAVNPLQAKLEELAAKLEAANAQILANRQPDAPPVSASDVPTPAQASRPKRGAA